MKRLLILFLFLLASLSTPSAYHKVCYILAKPEISYYEPLIRAIVHVESKGDTWALNIKEQAVGPFQIRPIRVEDYNKLTGSNYKTWDFYDYKLSREMFLYYSFGLSYERSSREWNGGPKGMKKKSTLIYWQKVKNKIKE